MRRELFFIQLFLRYFIHPERVAGAADHIGKRRKEQGAEMELTGKIACQQGDIPDGLEGCGDIFSRGSVSQFLCFL